jgi:hypothetical protein
VTEVKSDIELLLRADIITNLALERPGGKFPSTFIIKPKALAPLPLSPFPTIRRTASHFGGEDRSERQFHGRQGIKMRD